MDFDYYLRKLNEFLSDKIFIDISCETKHSLALTIDGQVFEWVTYYSHSARNAYFSRK